MIIVWKAYCLNKANKIFGKLINYYQLNNVLVVPEINRMNQDGKDIIEYNIDNLKEKNFGEENLENCKIFYPEYNFDAAGNEPILTRTFYIILNVPKMYMLKEIEIIIK